MRILRTLLLSAAVLMPMAAAFGSVVVSMRMEPASTLPGLPVAFFFTITNSSDAAFHLSRSVMLDVTPPTGQPFLAEWNAPAQAYDEVLQPNDMIIPAGATREYYIPYGAPWEPRPEFFNDVRLNTPGRYTLQARLFEEGRNPPVVIHSTSAVLEVRTPTEIDAEAWNALRALQPDGWSLTGWAQSNGATVIARDYSSSGYGPYASLMANATGESKLDLLDRALQQQSTGPLADTLRLSKGQTLAGLFVQEFSAAELDKAEKHGREAQKILNDLLKTTRYPWLKDSANEALKQIHGPDDLAGWYAAIYGRRAPVTEHVVPFVDCIDRTARQLVARFGYTNPATGIKVIQPGSLNRVAPGPPDQGQPHSFKPGRNAGVFSASLEGAGALIWHLDNSDASITDQSSPCDPSAALPLRLIVECVHHENEGVVVTFGYDNPNTFALVIPIGTRNHFDASPDSGQPDIFLSGRQKYVFKVKVKDAPVTWTVDHATVTANPRDSVACVE